MRSQHAVSSGLDVSADNMRAVPAGAPLAVALFNDHGDSPHTGSLAVSQAHRRLLGRAGAIVRHAYFGRDWRGLALAHGSIDRRIADALMSAELRRVFAEVDAVVVNGEDTLHHRQGGHLVAILGAAQRLGLPTFLVNALAQDCDEARAVLTRLTDCTVRDARSARYLRGLRVPHRLVPDSIFEAEFLDTPTRDLRGHLVVTDGSPVQAQAWAGDVLRLIGSWAGPVTEYALEDQQRVLDWRHAVADLGPAAAVVTGRFHGACLALRAGVPFVALPSATWELDGLIETLPGYPAAAADRSRTLAERVLAAIAARDWFARAGARFSQRAPLSTFARLLPGLAPTAIEGRAVALDPRAVAAVRAVTPDGSSVLHAGAGQGHLVEALAEHGHRAWGTDVAWRLARPDRNRYSMGTPTALPFADHVFDTVAVSADWLDHLELDQLDQAVAELARVGRGTLIVEISGRALRSQRAANARRDAEWWDLRLQLHGFQLASGATGDAAGAGTWVTVRTRPRVCAGCGRAHDGTTAAAAPGPPVPPAVIAAQAGRLQLVKR